MSHDTTYIIEGDIYVKHVNERTVDKLTAELANVLAKKAIDNLYANRYRIYDDELEVDGDDDSNPDNIVPFVSGKISFWCESQDFQVTNDVYYVLKGIEDVEDGITHDVWVWDE